MTTAPHRNNCFAPLSDVLSSGVPDPYYGLSESTLGLQGLSDDIPFSPAFSGNLGPFNHNGLDSQSNTNTIAFASHNTLMRSKDAVYMQIYQRFLQGQNELDRLKKENASLLAQRETYQNAYTILASSVPQLLSINNPLGISIPSLESSAPAFLINPGSVSTQDSVWPKVGDFTEEELKKVFWSKSSWNSHVNDIKGATDLDASKGKRGRTRAAEGVNVKMLYVVDKHGSPIDGHRASAMRMLARSIWAQLSDNGIAPSTWMTDSGLRVADHYRREMQIRFEELRLCEGSWKADQIAIDYYSSWRTARCKRGKFNVRVKQEDPEASDDEDNTNDKSDVLSDNKVPSDTHKRKAMSEYAAPTKKRKEERSAIKIRNPLLRVSSISTMTTTTITVDGPAFAQSSEDVEGVTTAAREAAREAEAPVSADATAAPASHGMPSAMATVTGPAPAAANSESSIAIDEAVSTSSNEFSVAGPLETTSQPPASLLPSSNTRRNPQTRISAGNKLIKAGDKCTARHVYSSSFFNSFLTRVWIRNFCIREWIAANSEGTVNQFKAYWDDLSNVDKKRFYSMEKEAKAAAVIGDA